MEDCLSYLFCRTPRAKVIAKHVAFVVIPQAVLGGVLAGLRNTHPSQFEGELEKYIFMGLVIVLIVSHLIYLVYYYRRVIEKCRARRQVYFVDVQPMRMWPQERRAFVDEQQDRMVPQERPAFVDEDNYVEFHHNGEVLYMA